MEHAISKKQVEEMKGLEKQLKSRQITQSSFAMKQRDLEKWVTAERKELKQKREKVKDTCTDIAAYLLKLE